MKEKLRQAIVNKYKKLGYSQKAIDAVLSHLEKSVTEEDQIEEAVNGIEGLLNAFQSEIDSRVTTAVAEAKKPKQENGGAPAEEKKDEPNKPVEEVPAWAKDLISSVTSLKAEKTATTRKQQLEDRLKEANQVYKDAIMESFEHMTFATDDAFTGYLGKVDAKLGELSKEQESVQNKAGGTRPPISNKQVGATKRASKEELDGVMSSILP